LVEDDAQGTGSAVMNRPLKRVKLEPNKRKLLEAIVYLIERGEREGQPLTQYQIVKSLFLADTAHLNRYGRPITFDNYSALEFGPVPEEAYDMLKPTYSWRLKFEAEGPPWERVPAGQGSACHYVSLKRPPNLRVLSRSDIQYLSAALDRVRELGFGGIRDETHTHPAYVEAWERRGDGMRAPIDYALLLEDADREAVEDLAFASVHRAG